MIEKITNYQILTEFLTENKTIFWDSLQSIEDIAQYTKKFLLNGQAFISVSEKGELKGLIMGYMNNQITRIGYVSILMSKKEFSRNGVGSELLAFFEKKAKESNMNKVQLTVIIENKNAVNFYLKNNYTIIESNNGRYLLNKNI